MTRTVIAPSFSSITVDNFYGMASDRNGLELNKAEFTTLTNIRNADLKALEVRLGGTKVFSQTETSGSNVRGMHTFVNDAGTELYVKACNGEIHKSSGSTWSEITGSKPGGGFTDADTWMATITSRDTGAGNTQTGTTTNANATSIEDDGSGWTVNAYEGDVLVVNSETKRIIWNDAEIIGLAEAFDVVPSADAFTTNPRAQEFFLANGTDFYKCDGTTFTRLDNSNYARGFDGIVTHQNRMWGWKGTVLYYSDKGVGEHFSRNSLEEFQTPIKRVFSFGNVLVVFERAKVSAIYGDRPDSFRIVEVLPGVGTTAPKSVGVYGDYLFFVSEEYGVCVLSLSTLTSGQKTNEPISVSEGFINNDLLAQSSANLKASCGGVHKGEYHLCVDDDWYRLNVKASLDAPRDPFGNVHWIWSKDDRPAAMDANVLGHYGTRFVAGAQDNGQVYEIEQGATYDDDGTAISFVIDKQDWAFREYGSNHRFWTMNVRQNNTASSTLNISYFFVPGGSTYGSAVQTIDLNTATEANHRIKITSDPSDPKGTGETISYKITGSASQAVPKWEKFNLLFYPGILQ